VDAYECEVTPDNFQADSLRAFRSLYPKGGNFVTSPWIDAPYRRRHANLTVTYGTPGQLLDDGSR